MKRRGVASQTYGERWIDAAWGEGANARLLAGGGVLVPRPRVARALELAGLGPGVRLLDVACGRGEVAAIASQTGAEAIGIDFSEAAVSFARRVCEGAAAGGDRGGGGTVPRVVRADACRLPFPDGTFDRVTLLDIVEHLLPDQLEGALGEVRRVLAPRGYAVIHTLPNRWFYELFPLVHAVVRGVPADPRGPIEREVHVNEQDIVTLRRLLGRCGFSSRVWLEQMMPAQARWNDGRDQFGDYRDGLYPSLAGRAGRVLEWVCRTPARLLLSNDIYAVAWVGGERPAVRVPNGWAERMVGALAGT